MPETTNFIILIIIRVINFFYPRETDQSTRISFVSQVPNRIQRTYRQRGNRIYYRRRHYIDLEDNTTRAHIIYLARRITANNRRIASQAEQAFVQAIVQARREFSEEAHFAVRFLPTQNERPARPIRSDAAENVVHTPVV